MIRRQFLTGLLAGVAAFFGWKATEPTEAATTCYSWKPRPLYTFGILNHAIDPNGRAVATLAMSPGEDESESFQAIVKNPYNTYLPAGNKIMVGLGNGHYIITGAECK